MAEQPQKKRNFNAYWIYALIAVLLISFNLMNLRDNSISIQKGDFEILATKGYVEKLVVVKNEEKGEVYLKAEYLDSIKALDEEKYKNLKEIKEGFSGRSPDLEFETPSIENFENEVEELQVFKKSYYFRYQEVLVPILKFRALLNLLHGCVF